MRRKASIDASDGAEEKSGGGAGAPSGSQTLLRGLDVLEGIMAGPAPLNDLAKQLGLTRSTTHRLANALIERRYLTFLSGVGYQLGPKLLELGYAAQRHVDILTVAKPVLAGLSARTGLSSFLAERQGDESVNLLSTPGTQRVAIVTPVGTRRQLAETSLGKALILGESEDEWQRLFAKLDPIYRRPDWVEAMRASAAAGVVVHAGPPPDHVRAVATPIRSASGEIVAGISLVTVQQYMDCEQIAALAPLILEAAAAISAELGYQPAEAPAG